jgi:hypothetical protein
MKTAPLANVAVPETFKLVKFPVEAVVAPIGVLSMAPPVIVAPDEWKLLAVVEPLKVAVPLTARVLFKVVAPVTPSVPPKVVPPVPTANGFAPETVVEPFKVILPLPVENVPVPDCAKFPEEFKLVNDPVEAMVAPIGVLLIEPPVMVAPDEANVFAVVAPFKETVPVPVENVPLPDWIIFPVAVNVVNFPVEGALAPMAMLSIEPPVSVAPDEANVFAVVAPFKETVPVPVANVPLPD